MNFGILLGALIAAGLAGRFNPIKKISLRDVTTAIVGGCYSATAHALPMDATSALILGE